MPVFTLLSIIFDECFRPEVWISVRKCMMGRLWITTSPHMYSRLLSPKVDRILSKPPSLICAHPAITTIIFLLRAVYNFSPLVIGAVSLVWTQLMRIDCYINKCHYFSSFSDCWLSLCYGNPAPDNSQGLSHLLIISGGRRVYCNI